MGILKVPRSEVSAQRREKKGLMLSDHEMWPPLKRAATQSTIQSRTLYVHDNQSGLLTDIDKFDSLRLGDEIQSQLVVLHLLSMNAGLFVVTPQLLLREKLQKDDQPHPITQVLAQVLDLQKLGL